MSHSNFFLCTEGGGDLERQIYFPGLFRLHTSSVSVHRCQYTDGQTEAPRGCEWPSHQSSLAQGRAEVMRSLSKSSQLHRCDTVLPGHQQSRPLEQSWPTLPCLLVWMERHLQGGLSVGNAQRWKRRTIHTSASLFMKMGSC